MSGPSDYARAKAFNMLTRHPDCLQDDYPLQDLIDDIAAAIDEARNLGMEEVSRAWFTEKPSIERFQKENMRLRDVLTWSEQNCPGECAGMIRRILEQKLAAAPTNRE